MRKALPVLMTLTVAVRGCTTNRTPGNGQPVTTSPSMSPANTYGSSSGNVPMTSSYLTPSTSGADRAAYAAEVMRQHQQYQPRFLGYLNPEPRVNQQPVQDYATGQFINPSLTANPEITVNSSISSQPNPVITGGAAVGLSTDGGFVVPGGSTSGTTATTGTALTAPLTAAGATVGTGTRILTPTLSSGATPSPLAVSGAVTPMASASTGITTTTATPTSTLNTNIVAPLNVTTTPTGQVMITNVRTGSAGK